jgi:Kef-type K+ transport system membrane component KefB/nucleotide-binding universal stress UspA family protein
MNDFKANRNKSLLFGFFTFIIPLIVGFPVCHYFLGYDFNASLLTATMFATHTLVAYPIVSKVGISKNQAVAVTVGGTILADTVALIILAVILGNSKGSLNTEFWLRLGISLAVFTAIMFLVIPKIAEWFFRKLESEKHSHYIFVLFIVFIAAFLAELAGVEPIIGAFVAGLAINKLIPQSSVLMNRIEFIGNSLFIPFFLISVGMLVDVRVILSGTGALIVAATLSVVALFGKWAAAWVTQVAFKYTNAQRQLIYGLSSARAAATLAIVLVGYEAGILDDNILNGTVILILATCIIASFATEKAAKQIVMESGDESLTVSKDKQGYHEHILMPIANLENIEKLLEFATFIKDKKSINPVSILSVVSNNEEAELNILKARNKLEKFVEHATAADTNVNVITTIDHNAASGIARISREIMADAIVLGWPRKMGLVDILIGQKVDSILNNTDKTTFICSFEKPLVTIKRMVLIAPPLAELERGFELWFTKLMKLAQELSIPVALFCNANTEIGINKLIEKAKINANINYKFFDEWHMFLKMTDHVKADDLVVLVSARRTAPSYMYLLEKLPAKLERYFLHNSRIIVYPLQYNKYTENERYDDITVNQGK